MMALFLTYIYIYVFLFSVGGFLLNRTNLVILFFNIIFCVFICIYYVFNIIFYAEYISNLQEMRILGRFLYLVNKKHKLFKKNEEVT